jgi:uncharacterized protein (TIGR02145 family)
MAVPDTNTFSMQDVVDEINPSSNDLITCFDESREFGFDETYIPAGFDPHASDKSGFELLYFRNYQHGTRISRGRLYNYYAVDFALNNGGFISGLSVPDDLTFKELELYIGVPSSEINSLKWDRGSVAGKLAGNRDFWEDGVLKSYNLFNIMNFYAIGAGYRLDDSKWQAGKVRAAFWTQSVYDSNTAYSRLLDYDKLGIRRFNDPINCGLSVRCMRTLTSTEKNNYNDGDIIEVVQDYDGNNYEIVKIDDIGWTRQNIATTHYANGASIYHAPSDSEWSSMTSAAYCNFNNDPGTVKY